MLDDNSAAGRLISRGRKGWQVTLVTPPSVGRRKLTELDALRGIAALIVFAGHFCEGLVPGVTASLNGSLLFVALNGPGAVIVFFVLSGFVLTLRPLRSRQWSLFAALALKRWPRLAGPVAVAGLGYSLMALIGAFPRPEHLASALPPHYPAYLFWGQAQHNERMGEVLREALVGTFLHESAAHNGVLWTMHWEFLGSLLAAALAMIVLLRLPLAMRVAMFAALWAAASAYSPWLIAFPVGVAGAALHVLFGHRIRIGNRLAIAMLLCGAALLSWDIRAQVGIWAWTGGLGFSGRISLWVATESGAACLWMAVALHNTTIRQGLSSYLGALAGRLSFSFYLVHLLALCSVSSWLYVLIVPAGPGVGVGVALFVVSLAASCLLAMPLMIFDQWWIRVLDHFARGLPWRPSARQAG